jgi:Protein of unknown function (DUF1264)/DNA polymerase family B
MMTKQEIAGGNSIEPKNGFYRNEPIDELDVKGMYSCKENPTAKIPADVMNEINKGLNKKGIQSRTVTYWICRLRIGAFPTKLNMLIMERERYQRLLKEELAKPRDQQNQDLISYYEARQIALKLLANAGYCICPANATLIGIEYMIDVNTYNALPDREKPNWHYHKEEFAPDRVRNKGLENNHSRQSKQCAISYWYNPFYS